MNLLWILVIVLILFAIFGASPQFGVWRHSYGYAPSSLVVVVVVILLALLLLGRW